MEEFGSTGQASLEEGILYFPVYIAKKGREGVSFALTPNNDDKETLMFEIWATTKYPNGGARNKKYLECMAEELEQMDLSIEVIEKNHIRICGSLKKETFGCQDWKSAYPQIGDLIHCLSHMLISLILVTHINARMSNRGGSEKYKKLLPSRLAALTMCGHMGVTYVN